MYAYYKSTTINRWCHFWENRNFFLCEQPLILGKLKKTAHNIYMSSLDMEFEKYRKFGLGSTFGDGHTDIQTHTLSLSFSLSLPLSQSTPGVQWLSYSPLDPRFAGSIAAGVEGFFQSVKILSMTSFGREVKPWVPCCRFTAHKRTSSRNYSLWANVCRTFHALYRKRRWKPKMLKSRKTQQQHHTHTFFLNPFLECGSETWSLTLREEHRLST